MSTAKTSIKQIPITIISGFLGAGKTTLVNKIIQQNPQFKFGLIINEFGEVGIDGQIIEDSGQELVELSNGCMCCIVRSDLYSAVDKLISGNNIDYILIEASGLAEPKPIADTFMMNNLDGRVKLDAIVCLLDKDNFQATKENYQIAIDQLKFCDILLLNKDQTPIDSDENIALINNIRSLNPGATIMQNNEDFPTKLLIDIGIWDIEKLEQFNLETEKNSADSIDHHHEHADKDHHHEHSDDNHDEKKHSHNHNDHHGHDHHHEHDSVDEIVFSTNPGVWLDPQKLDNWMQNQFPVNCVRAKGILRIKIDKTDTLGDQSLNPHSTFLFQMVGASKMLVPFNPPKSKNVNLEFSRMVLIGKQLNKAQILNDLEQCQF
jgi:G3E family GTPase